jgi:hypothetical protein
LVFLAGAQVVKISRSNGSSPCGQVLQHQLAAVHLERGALAVDQHAGQVQLFAVERSGCAGTSGLRRSACG